MYRLRGRRRWILALVLVSATLTGTPLALRAWHQRQKQVIAEQVLSEAKNAWRAHAAKPAVALFEQYYALRPTDRTGRADYARVLDEAVTAGKGRHRVFLTYEDALRDNPEDVELRRRLVEVSLELQRVPDASHHLEALHQSGSDDAWYWLQAARCQQLQGHFHMAANSARDALQRDPQLITAAELLSDLLANRLERGEEVDPLLDRVVEANPRSAAAHRLRAEHFLRSQRPERAEGDLKTALEISPDDRGLLLAASRWGLAMLQRDFSERPSTTRTTLRELTRERLTRGIALFPDSVDFHLLNADLDEQQGDSTAARQVLTHALERMPDDVRLLARMADLCIRQDDLTEAEKWIERIPDGNVTQPLKRFLEGRRQMQSRLWSDARTTLELALRESTENGELSDHISIFLADCYRMEGQEDLEAASYRRILRNNPASDSARLGLAELAARQQRWNDAILEFRLLKHRDELRPRLAELLMEKNGRLPEEARDWREFLALVGSVEDSTKPNPANRQLLERAEKLGFDRDAAHRLHAFATATYGERANHAAETPVSNALSEQRESLHSAVESRDLVRAVTIWKTLQDRENSEEFAVLTAELGMSLLAEGDLSAPQIHIDWLQKRFRTSIFTSQLRLAFLEGNGRHEEAINEWNQAWSAADRDEPGRRISLILLAVRAAEGRLSVRGGPSVPNSTANWNELSAAALKSSIQDSPERLVAYAAFFAMAEEVRYRNRILFESRWEEWRAAVSNNHSILVRSLAKLAPNWTRRLELAAMQSMTDSNIRTAAALSLADLESLLGRQEVAESWYRHVLQAEPDNSRALNNLAWMTALSGRPIIEAEKMIELAIRNAGEEARLLDTRGCVLLAKGDARGALRNFEKSLSLQPGATTALHLASARIALGDKTGAEHAWKVLIREGVLADDLHPLERPAFLKLEKALGRSRD